VQENLLVGNLALYSEGPFLKPWQSLVGFCWQIY